MMTHAQVEALLTEAGIPVAYHHFDAPQEGPFLVYLDDGNDPFFADNCNFEDVTAYRLELYSAIDPEQDAAKIAAVLNQQKIPYTKDFAFVESKKLFEVIFEIEV